MSLFPHFWGTHKKKQAKNKCFDEIKAKADKGDKYFQYLAAQMYDLDDNFEGAAKYFRMSASQGHMASTSSIGDRLMRGQGCELDPEKGLEMIRIARAKADPFAIKLLASHHSNKHELELAFELYLLGTKHDDPFSHNELGKFALFHLIFGYYPHFFEITFIY